jgi:hypothetical protein
MGQFWMKMGSYENGKNTPLPFPQKRETGSHKYEMDGTKVENRMGHNEICFIWDVIPEDLPNKLLI